jgi:hypothetical protein
MDTREGVHFPGGKARPGRDADDIPPSSAKVKNEQRFLLSPLTPAWRVAGQLYFTIKIIRVTWERVLSICKISQLYTKIMSRIISII